jgi:hypothetical protein
MRRAARAALVVTGLLATLPTTAGATAGDPGATGSHRAELPRVRVVPATFTEPTFGHRLGFTRVRLSAPSSRRVVVEISTRNGTAKAGQDFVRLHPTVVFAPGDTSALVSVELLADDRDEPTETMRLAITEVRHAVAERGGRIWILDAPGG